MKNYKHILEAVNRGIQLALDDFDDEEPIIKNIKSKQIQNKDYTKEYLDLMKEIVDLGLPSGTLWCKYNLGVNPNYLNTSEDWYGKYYAWGELKGNKTNKDGKICFNWSNYKFGKNFNKLTKYCRVSKYGLNGYTDNLTELLPDDDAAYQNKHIGNYKFHIPTEEQRKELKNYTNNYWVNNYDPNKIKHNSEDDGGIQGLNGRIFEGKNGNQLFIPAAGYYSGSNINYVGSYCYLWTSSFNLNGPSDAFGLYFNPNNIDIDISDRYRGYNIRPVINL